MEIIDYTRSEDMNNLEIINKCNAEIKKITKRIKDDEFLITTLKQRQIDTIKNLYMPYSDCGYTYFYDYINMSKKDFIEKFNAFTEEYEMEIAFVTVTSLDGKTVQEYADDLEKYTYSALLHKRCIICGKKADLHHVDQISMGYSRETKPQLGARVLPLCRVHHTEYHTIGGTAFGEKYHVVPVTLDRRLAQKYNITGRAAS